MTAINKFTLMDETPGAPASDNTTITKGTYFNGDIVTKDSIVDKLPTTTSDLIDSAIWSLPFDDRMKVWDLIEKLVEEEKVNLYTEEQVREAIEDARDILSHVNTDEVIKSLKQPKNDK